MIAEHIKVIIIVVAIEVAIDYWNIPSTDVIAIVDIAAMDSVVTSVSVTIKPHIAAIKIQRVEGGVLVETIRLPKGMTLSSVGVSVTIHNWEAAD